MIDGNAYLVDYGSAGVGMTQGGSLNVTGHTRVRRRDSFRFGQQISYDPLFSLGPTTSIEPVVDVDNLPQNDPATGVFELSSWASNTGLAYDFEAGQRTSIDLSYEFEARQYEDVALPEANVGSDMTAHRATVAATRNLNRTWGLRTRYHALLRTSHRHRRRQAGHGSHDGRRRDVGAPSVAYAHPPLLGRRRGALRPLDRGRRHPYSPSSIGRHRDRAPSPST